MLLRLRRRWMAAARDDRGNVLIPVIGLLALMTVIAMVVTTSTTYAMATTTSTRAGVQAQAAADAGLAVATAKLATTGACASAGGVFQNKPGVTGYDANDPQYRATVWRQVGGTWVLGCPLDTTTTYRVISTGYADDGGAGGITTNDERYMESVYNRQITVDAGSALTFYSATQMDSNVVISGTGSTASLQMINGNYSCTNAGTIDASLYVPNGNVTITNHCYIKGSVYSSGTVSMDSYGRVGGDVYAVGKVSMQNNATIDGNLYTDGAAEVNNSGLVKGNVEARGETKVTGGRVYGNVWGQYISSITGRIDGTATSSSYSADTSVKTQISPGSTSDRRVGGNVVLGGSIDTWTVCNNQWTEAGMSCGLTNGGSVGGTISLHQASVPLPTSKTLPAAKTWVDVPWKKSDWTDVGFSSTVYTWPSNACELNNNNTVTPTAAGYDAFQFLKNLTGPTIIDARNCATLTFGNSVAAADRTLKLKADVLFLVRGFSAQNWTFDSNTTDVRRMYIVSPDEVASTPTKPDCVSGTNGAISWNGDKMTSTVRGFIYTPCNFYWGASATVNGQIYSGSYSQANSNETLTYYPVGIPGVDMGGGGSSSTAGSYQLYGTQNRADNGE